MIIGGGSNLFRRIAGNEKPVEVMGDKPIVVTLPPATATAALDPAPEPATTINWKYKYPGVGSTNTELNLQHVPHLDRREEVKRNMGVAVAADKQIYDEVVYQTFKSDLPIPDVHGMYHSGFKALVVVSTRTPETYYIEVYCGAEYLGYCNLFAPRNWGIHTKTPGERFHGDKANRMGNKSSGWVIKGGLDPLDATEAIISLIRYWDNN